MENNGKNTNPEWSQYNFSIINLAEKLKGVSNEKEIFKVLQDANDLTEHTGVNEKLQSDEILNNKILTQFFGESSFFNFFGKDAESLDSDKLKSELTNIHHKIENLKIDKDPETSLAIEYIAWWLHKAINLRTEFFHVKLEGLGKACQSVTSFSEEQDHELKEDMAEKVAKIKQQVSNLEHVVTAAAEVYPINLPAENITSSKAMH